MNNWSSLTVNFHEIQHLQICTSYHIFLASSLCGFCNNHKNRKLKSERYMTQQSYIIFTMMKLHRIKIIVPHTYEYKVILSCCPMPYHLKHFQWDIDNFPHMCLWKIVCKGCKGTCYSQYSKTNG